MLITLIAFLAILGLLVLVHEWGHFYVARRAGVTVEEFGLGSPQLTAESRKELVKLVGEASVELVVLCFCLVVIVCGMVFLLKNMVEIRK